MGEVGDAVEPGVGVGAPPLDDEDVVARAAGQQVRAAPAADGVVSGPAGQGVLPADAALEVVVPWGPEAVRRVWPEASSGVGKNP